jgi:hypothetical protein
MRQSHSGGDYCDYLDKEMTIMGLLSAFSVIIPGSVLSQVASAKHGDGSMFSEVWKNASVLVVSGSLAFLFATLAFYLQRSLLAIYYGQLRFSQTPARYANQNEVSILRKADSWKTWTSYQAGFALLLLGFALYSCSFFAPHMTCLGQGSLVAVLVVLTSAYIILNRVVKAKADKTDSDTPWRSLFDHQNP